MSGITYADSSALVKLVVAEAGSAAMLRWFIEADRVLTSRVGVVETIRASSRRDHDATRRETVIRDVEVMELDAAIGASAAVVGSPFLRTLDAIHLASAMVLMPELDAFVTYDDRLAEAARSLGLPVVQPA